MAMLLQSEKSIAPVAAPGEQVGGGVTLAGATGTPSGQFESQRLVVGMPIPQPGIPCGSADDIAASDAKRIMIIFFIYRAPR
jgi:hypothetical protein